uniref:Ubiquitin-like domain-containing protein n=1 Tax=Polyblepharides amylifera TaxID=1486889 RepID=A0A7R9SUY0_9CHLO|mmetsp:Transcript_1108/g.1550  ORF Transcript_1108/g.1550 Transcript_1108/m.1550 type:complete len:158 (+) Transcript_1108:95-568(+)|eukprot:CAMPEP_0196587308 /NCGR_PEP_ID=MMETSP1081-20130531/57071_1 /TAXON_ID=36882 /ORGANISM="Pyramimonas amylifera, Strain CCMP720" /LENGTH=157 /DNA_ID=CAMNT_0041909457 /DNA_START=91 /DNA_END=564 /DNA_ORIENTATION=-
MASTGIDMGGNQIFVSLKKGKQWPPLTIDLRVKYEETIGHLKTKVHQKTSIPLDKIQLFWHKKELVSNLYDHLTLAQMKIHTGFGISGYDLTEEPEYWPPVTKTEKGLVIKAPITNPDYLEKNPGAENEPNVLKIEQSHLECAPGVFATVPIASGIF